MNLFLLLHVHDIEADLEALKKNDEINYEHYFDAGVSFFSVRYSVYRPHTKSFCV